MEFNFISETFVENMTMFDTTDIETDYRFPVNTTVTNDTLNVAAIETAYENCRIRLSTFHYIIFAFTYIIGAMGNLAALVILYRSEKQMRNKKIILMLRCLASNDLVALVGMLFQMTLHRYLPLEQACSIIFCVVRVIWRVFGLSSGCVAVVMAVERWLALTHPFLYQKHVTYNVIRRAIFCLWLGVFVLVCLPFSGFGLYYNSEEQKCARYREAEKPEDITYAYLFFTFGTLLCICIVICNLAVIRVLCHLGCRDNRRKVLGRRISRNSSRTRSVSSGSSTTGVITNGGEMGYHSVSTREEIAFARLMAVLCVGFVVCWMPQMVAILLTQWTSKDRFKHFYYLADALILIHFTLDPFIYVLLRSQRRTCLPNFLKIICHTCWSHPTTSQPTSIAMTEHEQYPSLVPNGQPPGTWTPLSKGKTEFSQH